MILTIFPHTFIHPYTHSQFICTITLNQKKRRNSHWDMALILWMSLDAISCVHVSGNSHRAEETKTKIKLMSLIWAREHLFYMAMKKNSLSRSTNCMSYYPILVMHGNEMKIGKMNAIMRRIFFIQFHKSSSTYRHEAFCLVSDHFEECSYG